MSSAVFQTIALKDEGELLYTTLVGMVMAAIFATGFHDNVEETLTNLAPEGTSYPFPAQTRLPAAKFASAIAGFLLGVFFWTLFGWVRWSLVRRLLTYRNWLKNPKSLKTKTWVICLRLLCPRKKYLNAFQHVLPRYPLPQLSVTCKKLLQVMEPLVTEEEFAQMQEEMREFEKGEGPLLQGMLEKRFQTEENWVSELWDNYAYLSQRTPILVNTSIGCTGAIKRSDLSPVGDAKQVGRAAALSYQYLVFWESVKNNTLPCLMVLDLVPICAARYRLLMACTRVPGLKMDKFHQYEDSKHIIVFRKGVMYRLDVYGVTPSGEERLVPPTEIQRQMEIILDDTAGMEDSVRNPSLFTTQDRATWAKTRERLQLKRTNAVSLRDVESAIFHVVLDDTSPETLTDEAVEQLCSTGFNLWADKSATIRAHENGRCGLHFEHATADATLFGRLLEFVWTNAKCDKDGNAVDVTDATHVIATPPQRLEWDLSQFEEVFPVFMDNLNKLCDNVEVQVNTVRQGKGMMKKCRVSPDGFMQMALQLAFYRMHKKVPKTYESASTRFFKFGRTETIRTVSKFSVAFTKAMDDEKVPDSEKISLLKKSIDYQGRYKLDAMNGEACDRHFFGLYCAAKLAGVESRIMKNKHLLAPDQLSTSQSPFCFDTKLMKKLDFYPSGGCFGPQRLDGYGVYYLFLADDQMMIHVTSFRSHPETSSSELSKQILRAMDDMKDLFMRNSKKI